MGRSPHGGVIRWLVAAALLVALIPAAADARSRTTLDQTITDRDGDNRLDTAPGDPYVVRDDLGQALPNRQKRRVELFFFGQLTDTHVVDEESPARVEFLDPTRARSPRPTARARASRRTS